MEWLFISWFITGFISAFYHLRFTLRMWHRIDLSDFVFALMMIVMGYIGFFVFLVDLLDQHGHKIILYTKES